MKQHCSRISQVLTAFHYLLTWVVLAACADCERKEQLGDLGLQVTLSCNSPESGPITWSHDDQPFTIDGPKYIVSFADRLTITNVVGEDEGTYKCHYGNNQERIAGCLYVLGRAKFRGCPEGLTCSVDPITTSAGMSVELDIGLQYVGAGLENMMQETNALYLKNGNGDFWLICNSSDCTLQPDAREGVSFTPGPSAFGFVVTITDVTAADEGTYTAAAAVRIPDTGSDQTIEKIFEVEVLPTSPSPTPSSVVSSETSASMDQPASVDPNISDMQTLGDSTAIVQSQTTAGTHIVSQTSTPGVPKGMSNSSSDVGTTIAAVVVVLFVVFILGPIVVVGIAAYAVYLKRYRGKFSIESEYRPTPEGSLQGSIESIPDDANHIHDENFQSSKDSHV